LTRHDHSIHGKLASRGGTLVTWLPSKKGNSPDEAAFGLLPDQWAYLRELHAAAWGMTDHALLQLCRLRMAQSLGRRRWPGISDSTAQELETWWTSARFTETERAALSYVDHFLLDCNAITPELNGTLQRCLGSLRALYQLVAAVNTVEGLLRACIVLDVDPQVSPGARARVEHRPPAGPAGDDAEPPPTDELGLREVYRSVVDDRFWRARAVYGASVVRLAGIDPLATECLRLRNATYQQCHY
jgi:hypothetical protein